MMPLPILLYNLFLWLALLLLAPVWLTWLALSRKARSGFRQKLSLYPSYFTDKLAEPSRRKTLWFHAVSVGEFNAIRPLVEALQEDYRVVVSTTTRTGQNLALRTFPDLPVCYFPYDFRGVVHRALQTIQPDLVILTETELWPNFIDVTTRRHDIPVILINGRISPKSLQGYQRAGFLIRPLIAQLSHIYAQSPLQTQRFATLGATADQLTSVGNIKFDIRTEAGDIQKNILAHLLNITPQDTVLTLASTHSGEDEPLIQVFQTLKKDFPELKLVIAPRHPERAGEIRTLLNTRALAFSQRSQLSEEHPNPHAVVILDSIGELVTVYGLSNLAVMGGSFVPKGGQNPLEPLSQKIPVIFGPFMYNFPDIAGSIVENHAGFQVQSPEEVVDLATELLTQPEIYSNVVENGQRFLEENRGAKDRLLEAIRRRV